jgi:hypothetical protein
MSATIREFLETYPLYKKFSIQTMPKLGWRGDGWRGDWPEVVSACCPVCRASRAFRMWPSKQTGFTPGWGVYMLSGTCESCGRNGLILWVDVNEHEGWMQKAGQLPGPALPEEIAVAESRDGESIGSN